MPVVEVNGARLNYIQMDCERGDDCEDLVMIHGLATNIAFWGFSHAPAFANRFRVTVYDLRGHGRSSMTDSGYAPENMATDLKCLLDHLGIERAHIIAHSFGGLVALNFALRNRERVSSLMLVDTHISSVRRLKRTKEWEFGRKIQPVLDQYNLSLDTRDPYFGYRLLKEVALMQTRNEEISQGLKDLVGPLVGQYGKRTASQWLKLMETTQAEKEMMGDDGLSLEHLRQLKFPILAIYGEHSQAMSTGEQLLDVWKHAEFRRVRGAGHFFPTSRPREIINNGSRFWQRRRNFMVRRRVGEPVKSYFRSDRFFHRDGAWFFFTREGDEHGPFMEKEDAIRYLESFISKARVAAG